MPKASGCNKVFSIKTTNKRSILKAGLMTEKKCVWDRNLVVFNSGPVLLSSGLKSRGLLSIVQQLLCKKEKMDFFVVNLENKNHTYTNEELIVIFIQFISTQKKNRNRWPEYYGTKFPKLCFFYLSTQYSNSKKIVLYEL